MGKLSLFIVLLLVGGGALGYTTVDQDGDGIPVLREAFVEPTWPFVYDTDADGIPDDEELQMKTKAAKTDTDGDGLDDGRELELGTDPLDKDTDEDGVVDYVEVAEYDSDPLSKHSDDDGLDDGDEAAKYGTNPTKEDTDGDGLPDDVEVNSSSSPTRADTDGDGLDDSRERVFGTAPNQSDTDADGLNDSREVDEFDTDPLDADTDDDGLEDGREVELGTNPNARDSDGDTLRDGAEVNRYSTDPLKADTDADGMDDFEEIRRGLSGNTADSDGDGLNDTRELRIGTSPTKVDTDGDHIPDGAEVDPPIPELEPADPLRKDVFVEMDYHDRNETMTEEERRLVVERYASAPVENPDGAKGISLHLHYSNQVDAPGRIAMSTYREEYYDEHFDLQGYGFHHMMFVDELQGAAGKNTNTVGFVVAHGEGIPRSNGMTFMHELGHQMGLWKDDFDGIDSKAYSIEAYPSVMNYNSNTCSTDGCARSKYQYSSGEGFDDWEHIAEAMGQRPPDTSELKGGESSP